MDALRPQLGSRLVMLCVGHSRACKKLRTRQKKNLLGSDLKIHSLHHQQPQYIEPTQYHSTYLNMITNIIPTIFQIPQNYVLEKSQYMFMQIAVCFFESTSLAHVLWWGEPQMLPIVLGFPIVVEWVHEFEFRVYTYLKNGLNTIRMGVY